MKIEDIRNGFPKCRVFISPDKVSLIFCDYSESGWITAAIDYEQKILFEKLLPRCIAVSIAVFPKRYARLDFHIHSSADCDLLFPAIKTESEFLTDTDEELLRLNNVYSFEFLESFADRNIFDDGEVLVGFSDLIHRTDSEIGLPEIQSWYNLRNSARDFYRKSNFLDYYEDPPADGSNFGSVEFSVISKNDIGFRIDGDCVQSLLELINMSDGGSLESRISDHDIMFRIALFS